MRTKEKWEKKEKEKAINSNFTPRLREILLNGEKVQISTLNSFFIHGSADSGKTVYTAFYLLEWLKNKYLNDSNNNYIFTTTSDLFFDLKKRFKDNTDIDYIAELREVDLLIIDDFGTMKLNEWVLDTLYLILNYRYEHLKTTVITSNYNITELTKRLNDSRVPNRIKRMCTLVNYTR